MSNPNLETLSDQADSVKRDLREVTIRVAEHAEEFASDVSRNAIRLADEATRTGRQAKDRFAEVYDRGTEKAGKVYRGARGYVRTNPAMTAAITFATGVGLGLLLAPRRSHQSSRALRQGMFPVAAIALAQAVLEMFDDSRS